MVLCIVPIAVWRNIVLGASFDFDGLVVCPSLAYVAELAWVVSLTLFAVLLLHYNHWIVDFEEVVPHLSCVGITSKIDSCCSLKNWFLLPLSLWTLRRKFKQRLLLRLLDKIIHLILQNAPLRGFWWVIWPSRGNSSLLITTEFGRLWCWARHIVVSWESNTCLASFDARRLLIDEFDFEPAIPGQWLARCGRRRHSLHWILLVGQSNLILLDIQFYILLSDSCLLIRLVELQGLIHNMSLVALGHPAIAIQGRFRTLVIRSLTQVVE